MTKLKVAFNRRRLGIYLSILIAYGFMLFLAGNWFNATFEVRSPIVKRSTTIISPMSKKTSLVPHVEVANAAPVRDSVMDSGQNEQELNATTVNGSAPSSELSGSSLKSLVFSYFPPNERAMVDELVQRESSWNAQATNPTSGAYGLFQILPFEKSACERDNIRCQTLWFQAYLEQRYNGIEGAVAHHNRMGWY